MAFTDCVFYFAFRDKKTTTCLFNLHPPQKKTEWTAELENAKLRIGKDLSLSSFHVDMDFASFHFLHAKTLR